MSDISHRDQFAIIGVAGRFPGARDLAAFWDNLAAGRESIWRGRSDEQLLARGILEGAEYFDAAHFGYSPQEARLMDPQQRLLLVCAWEAIEDAGYPPRRCSREMPVGLFACSSDSQYATRDDVEPAYWPMVGAGNDRDFLAPRVSYKLDLRGPSVVVQSACSSALVCVHMACQSLLCGESDVALAGAVSVALPQMQPGGPLLEGGIVAPDGRCRAFDAVARGTVRGFGMGVVVIRRLEDARAAGDDVRAVILGSAVNNDGADKIGFSAPGVEGQAAVVSEALAVAGVSPDRVSYVEAHGSGTALGDPLEIAALNRAFRGHGASCAIGSVKTNIGHLDAAAGMAGLIKTVLCLQHRRLVPSLHFREPNPEADFAGGPFEVCDESAPWESGPRPRVAGVSSFGMGGTNAHVVLQEWKGEGKGEGEGEGKGKGKGEGEGENLLVLSARTAEALETAACRLAEHLRREPDLTLDDVAFTLQTGREHMAHRMVVAATDLDQAAAALEERDPSRISSAACRQERRPVTFMFSGLGDQQVGMGRDLYRHQPEFARHVDRCAELLRPFLGRDLREVLFAGGAGPSGAAASHLRLFGRDAAPEDELDQPQLAHPALFVLGYALARMWMARGVHPREMIGYSIGEYVAACLSGVFSLQDALHLVAVRARLVAGLPAGAMLAVPAPEEQVRARLGQGLHISAVNGPRLCVVSGEVDAVLRLQGQLTGDGLASMRLRATHPFHSPLLEPAAHELAELVAGLPRGEPDVPFVSNLTGTWITAEQAADPRYWAAQMTSPVRFADGLRTLCEDPSSLLLELGPGQTLCSLATPVLRYEGLAQRPVVASLPAAAGEPRLCVQATGQVWLAGCEVSWPLAAGRRVPLPTYPFQRDRYVLQRLEADRSTGRPVNPKRVPTTGRGKPALPPEGLRSAQRSAQPPLERGNLTSTYCGPETPGEEALVACFERAFGISGVGVHDSFFDLGGHSLLALQMLHDLRRASGLELSPRDVVQAPTIRELAPRARAVAAPMEDGSQKAEAGDQEVTRIIRVAVAEGLGVDPGELALDQSVSRPRLQEAVPQIIWSVKRRLGLPLYPHEVLARPTVESLARLVQQQLRGPVDDEADPGGEAGEELERALAAAAEQARGGAAALARRAPPAAFILSSARSGSTLLRVMLAGHPDLFCPPELHLLMYEDLEQRQAALPSAHFGRGLRRALDELLSDPGASGAVLDELQGAPMGQVYRRLQRLAHPRLLVDKSPSYAASVEALCRAERLFEAPRYLFLFRHPLAVMESHVRTRMAAMAGPGAPAAGDAWAAAEYHWTTHNRNVMEFLRRVPARRQLQLGFEALVSTPREVMEQVCEFLQVPFHEATLAPHSGGRMTDGPGDPGFHERVGIDPDLAGAWREVKLPRPLRAATGDVARSLGYDVPNRRGSTTT